MIPWKTKSWILVWFSCLGSGKKTTGREKTTDQLQHEPKHNTEGGSEKSKHRQKQTKGGHGRRLEVPASC